MEIKEQLQKLILDMNKNIKDEKDLKYVQENVIKIMVDILQKMDDVNKDNQTKIAKLEEKMDKMAKELYLNDVYDIEIVCPYCNYQFETDFDEDKKEVKCPECNNVIELDWSCDDDCDDCGDCDDGCGDGCSSCTGCGHHHDNDEDLEDDM
ncbi:MAG: hypothetical protein ACLU8Y_05285 [Clostridia bacterium]|jgi:uncharacterized Zn-finger protein